MVSTRQYNEIAMTDFTIITDFTVTKTNKVVLLYSHSWNAVANNMYIQGIC